MARKANEGFAVMGDSLQAMEQNLASLKESGSSATEKLDEIVSQVRSINASLNLGREEAQSQRQEVLHLLESAQAERKAERKALRSAFGQFAMSNQATGEVEKK